MSFVEHIEGNIYCIKVPLPRSPLGNLNAYFIKGGERNLLIDTGFRRPECREALEAGLRELDARMEDTDILLTHLHSDHTGNAPDIATPTTRIFVSEPDRAIMRRKRTLKQFVDVYSAFGFPQFELDHFMDAPSMKYVPVLYEDYLPVADGEILEYGGRRLRVVYTPGHTPGHICLYDEEAAVMFLGDHVLFDITPNITTWENFADPLGTYVHSLMDISCYDIRVPLPAHRTVSCTVAERVGTIIEHHGRRIREMLDILEKKPGLTPYELSSHMSWDVHGDKPGWEYFPVSQKWFAVGETAAHLEYLLPRGRVSRENVDGVWHYVAGEGSAK